MEKSCIDFEVDDDDVVADDDEEEEANACTACTVAITTAAAAACAMKPFFADDRVLTDELGRDASNVHNMRT